MKWGLPLYNGVSRISYLPHLAHLARFSMVDYEIYTVSNEWVLLDTQLEYEMDPGDILVARPVDTSDEKCEDLPHFIRRVHSHFNACKYAHYRQVPQRYQVNIPAHQD